jgi:hypothetical protein
MARGDVAVLTDDSGNARATYGYTAYGSPDKNVMTGVGKPDPADPDKEPCNTYRFNAKRLTRLAATTTWVLATTAPASTGSSNATCTAARCRT